MANVKVAILGFGTVGYGVYRIVQENGAQINHKDGVNLQVTKVLVRSMDEPNVKHARGVCTTSLDEIIASDADIVVECIGGENPAKDFILKALQAKKTVVTSNKEVIAKHWPILEQTAKDNGVGLYIEATVCGGIPIIKTIYDSMQANNITKIMGIINGTTNYILTKMTNEHLDFGVVLKEAQALGYAEADPKNDVEAYDNMYKLSILGSLAFHAKVPASKIYREGIVKITPEDIAVGKEFGYIVKMLAIGKKTDNNIEVRVHPTMIPMNHPLASVNDAFNAVFINGDNVGDIMLYGSGAGQLPTASAVVSDVVFAARFKDNHLYTTFANKDTASDKVNFVDDWETAAFVNLSVKDEVGVLSKVSSIFCKNNISIASMIQKSKVNGSNSASIIFITHKAQEKAIRNALCDILDLSCVNKLVNMIRIEN